MKQEKNVMKENKIFTNTIIVALLALLCCALWGSATPFIKTGYNLMLPETNTQSIMLFAGIRFAFAGILTILIYSITGRKFLVPEKQNWGCITIVGAFQTVIQYIFFYVGLSNTSGVKGTIASGANAFFAMLIAGLIFKQEKVTLKKIIACILGFAGIIMVNLNGLELTINFTGDVFVLISAASAALASVLMKNYSKKENPVVISGYQFILGGIALIIVGFLFGGRIVVTSAKAAAVLLYLALLSAIAYSVWGILLKYNKVSRVTIYTFMTPVFGVLLSNLMLSEKSNVSPLNLVITLVLVCSGIILLNYKKE